MLHPPRSGPRRLGRPALACLLVAAALGGVGHASDEEDTEDETGAATALREARELFLAGVDMALPAQEAFAAWPADSLVARGYWLPWSDLAFRRAALFQRPVLLLLDVNWSASTGRPREEVLADPAVQRTINGGFIAVRVNADLRPDVGERYETGAWPALEFLLPDGSPMLGQVGDPDASRPITSTLIDPDQLAFLLREGSRYWALRRDALIRAGREWVRREGPPEPLRGTVNVAASEAVARWMAANADRTDGGFGLAPKFVVPGLVEYAALRAARGADDGVLEHAHRTLERLVASPLYDAREGGVRRIATAASYGGIHREKMLAGNAALIRELTFALRDGDSPALRAALVATTGFVIRVLGREGGGFYLAEAADRPSPEAPALVDRLLLAGPNALAGAALLQAGALLGDAEVARAGRRALDLVVERGVDADGLVHHAIEPAAGTRVYLQSQADVALGLLWGYEATGEAAYLDRARLAVELALARLADPDATALRDHAPDPVPIGLLANPRRPLRANVRLARALRRLDLHGAVAEGSARAQRILGYYSAVLPEHGVHGIEAALAIEELLAGPERLAGATR